MIRGETYHFELVANEAARGVARVSLDYGVPIANAILTTETEEQAARASTKKGRDAARVAVEMANLLWTLGEDGESRRRRIGRPGRRRAARGAGQPQCAPARARIRAARPVRVAGRRRDAVPTIEGAACSKPTASKQADADTLRALLHGAIEDAAALRADIARHIDREVETLSPVEHAMLLIGAYELRHRLEIPYRVVINEAVELAKSFGGTDGYKYVNGVLDKLAGQLRSQETAGN